MPFPGILVRQCRSGLDQLISGSTIKVAIKFIANDISALALPSWMCTVNCIGAGLGVTDISVRLLVSMFC